MSSKIALENLSSACTLEISIDRVTMALPVQINFLLLISSIDDFRRLRVKSSFHRSRDKRLKLIEMDEDRFIDRNRSFMNGS